MTRLRFIASNFHIVSAVIIFMGYLHIYYYYRIFDISIYNYLEFGEILLSFFPLLSDITTFLILLIFISIIFRLTHPDINDNELQSENDSESQKENGSSGSLKKEIKRTAIRVFKISFH